MTESVASVDDDLAFLRRHSPFDALGAADLERVAAAAERRSYPPGTDALVEDGPPADRLYVVRSGSVALVHEDEVIELLEAGECFGHVSLLTGLAPSFTVRAWDDVVCLAVPAPEARLALSGPAGAGFVASTLRQRLVRTGQTVHGHVELSTVHVADLISGPLVYCEPTATVARAAQVMTAAGRSAVLVRGERLLIATDADIRSKVVANQISPDQPVLRIAEPAVLVEPTRLAVETVVDMLDHGVEHVVVVDAERKALGVVTAMDLMGLQSRSPFALRHAILHARDEDELVEVSQRLRTLFLALHDAGVSPADVGRVLTLQVEAMTTRLLELAGRRHGEAPAPWAWLALGSAARRELTLGSDQENALAYEGGDDPDADAYFERLAADVNEGLERCGFPPDANRVLASERLWRMPLASWEQAMAECFAAPDRSHLIRATVAFDFRQVAGALDATPTLVAVERTASAHPDFVRRLARTATDFKPPLGFRGTIVRHRQEVGRPGTIDVKRAGMLPVVNLARFHALAHQVTISATLDRLVAVEELGALPRDEATALREAFEVAWRIRLEHQAAQLDASRPPDDFVDPDALGPLEREELREAFRAISRAQKRLGVYVPAGL